MKSTSYMARMALTQEVLGAGESPEDEGDYISSVKPERDYRARSRPEAAVWGSGTKRTDLPVTRSGRHADQTSSRVGKKVAAVGKIRVPWSVLMNCWTRASRSSSKHTYCGRVKAS